MRLGLVRDRTDQKSQTCTIGANKEKSNGSLRTTALPQKGYYVTQNDLKRSGWTILRRATNTAIVQNAPLQPDESKVLIQEENQKSYAYKNK